MIASDRQTIHEIGRAAATAHRAHALATRHVLVGASSAAEQLGLSAPPVHATLNRLERSGILREATDRRRGKLYVYDQYLAILNDGTEPE